MTAASKPSRSASITAVRRSGTTQASYAWYSRCCGPRCRERTSTSVSGRFTLSSSARTASSNLEVPIGLIQRTLLKKSTSCWTRLEEPWGDDPHGGHRLVAVVLDAMRHRGLEVDAVAGVEPVLGRVNDVAQAPREHIGELLAVVAVRLLHAPAGLDRDQHRLQHQGRRPLREQPVGAVAGGDRQLVVVAGARHVRLRS